MHTSLSSLICLAALSIGSTALAAPEEGSADQDRSTSGNGESSSLDANEGNEESNSQGTMGELLPPPSSASRRNVLFAAQGHVGISSFFASGSSSSAVVVPIGANVLVAGLPGQGAFTIGGRATFSDYIATNSGGGNLWGVGAQLMLGGLIGRDKPTAFHYFMGGAGPEILFNGGNTTAVKVSGLYGTSLNGLGLGAGFDLLVGDRYAAVTLLLNIGYANLF